MSFFKRLFGGSSEPVTVAGGEPEAHKGYTIQATPYSEGGQYQTCGVISKEIDGERKKHRFVRADKFSSLDAAISVSLRKAKQIVDEQGDEIFR